MNSHSKLRFFFSEANTFKAVNRVAIYNVVSRLAKVKPFLNTSYIKAQK